MTLNELLIKHKHGELSAQERAVLHRLLKKKHAFGEKMQEYRCPNCNSPLTYSWAKGPICNWSEGGCGYSFS